MDLTSPIEGLMGARGMPVEFQQVDYGCFGTHLPAEDDQSQSSWEALGWKPIELQ